MGIGDGPMTPETLMMHGGEVYPSGPFVMRDGLDVRCVMVAARQYAPKIFCGHDARIYAAVVLPGCNIVRRARRVKVALRRWNRAVVVSRETYDES